MKILKKSIYVFMAAILCAAGLCANAGLGFVVLLKNTREWKRNLALIVVCYAVAVLVGFSVNAVALAIR